jgi:hypothetical protein
VCARGAGDPAGPFLFPEIDMSDETKTIATPVSQDGYPVPAFSFDLSTMQRLDLVAGENMQWPPLADGAETTEGGLWVLVVPAGKSVWFIDGPMSEAEEADVDLVSARAIPIWGPIYWPQFFEAGDYGHLVADGAGFSVWTARQKNNGGGA